MDEIVCLNGQPLNKYTKEELVQFIVEIYNGPKKNWYGKAITSTGPPRRSEAAFVLWRLPQKYCGRAKT